MKKIYEGCKTLLHICAKCQKDEKILIVTDEQSFEIGKALWDAAEDFPNKSLIMMPTQTMHGEEPTDLVAAAMMEADVIFRPTTFSISSTEAKRNAQANGARDLNCSDYDLRMLESGGLFADFEGVEPLMKSMAEAYVGKDITITTPLGTNITASIEGRKNLPQYGRSLVPGQTSSPPDIEIAICANNGTMNGVVYIDGAITHPRLGLIKEPVRMEVKDSNVVDISGGEEAEILKEILANYNDPAVYHIGEIGVGMNKACTLTGRMLEDEGCYGTIHFGLGDDRGFEGGTNSTPLHIDLVFTGPTMVIDCRDIIVDGDIVV